MSRWLTRLVENIAEAEYNNQRAAELLHDALSQTFPTIQKDSQDEYANGVLQVSWIVALKEYEANYMLVFSFLAKENPDFQPVRFYAAFSSFNDESTKVRQLLNVEYPITDHGIAMLIGEAEQAVHKAEQMMVKANAHNMVPDQ
jgi:hypothetical protein